jgi:FAM192A/Fyv6, N-terminal domain
MRPPAGKNRPLDEDELDFLDTLQQQAQHADAAWRAEQERELDAYQQVGVSPFSALQASPFLSHIRSKSARWMPTSRWGPVLSAFSAASMNASGQKCPPEDVQGLLAQAQCRQRPAVLASRLGLQCACC